MPHPASPDQPAPTVASRLRRPYHAPQLTELGSVAEVTLASASVSTYTSDGSSPYAS
jgi:hypothetical protein